MLLQLDATLLQNEIRATGGYSALKRRLPSAPDRTTIFRWVNGRGLPASEKQLVALATGLHIDPIALVRADATGFAKICDEAYRVIRGAITFGASKMRQKVSPFAYVLDFVSAAAEWPPSQLAGVQVAWKTFTFRHTAEKARNYYASILLTPLTYPAVAPCIFHFAYRGNASLSWRPYGFVKMSPDRLELYAYRGTYEAHAISAGMRPTVETYFGDGPAEFLVASVHTFRGELMHHAAIGTVSVRFVA